MILLSNSQTISIILGAPANTNQPSFVCSYVDLDNKNFVSKGSSQGNTNDANQVTIVSSPDKLIRQVKFISICNLDSIAQAITIQLNTTIFQNNTAVEINVNTIPIFSVVLQPNYTLIYDDVFKVIDNNGIIQ